LVQQDSKTKPYPLIWLAGPLLEENGIAISMAAA
jgi:hypothetical protein